MCSGQNSTGSGRSASAWWSRHGQKGSLTMIATADTTLVLPGNVEHGCE
jgi:hypothetical protein